MITDIFIICNKDQLKKVEDTVKVTSTFHFIDPLSKKGKKEAWALKNYWGAKLDPFAVVMDGDKPIKAFYSESENVIDNLIIYLNERID